MAKLERRESFSFLFSLSNYFFFLMVWPPNPHQFFLFRQNYYSIFDWYFTLDVDMPHFAMLYNISGEGNLTGHLFR